MLDALVITHCAHFLLWRKGLPGRVHALPGLQESSNRSCKQDIEDIRGADDELQKEVAFLEDTNPQKFAKVDDPLLDAIRGDDAVATPHLLSALRGRLSVPGMPLGSMVSVAVTVTGYSVGKMLDGKHVAVMEDKQAQWSSSWREVWMGAPVLKGTAAQDVAHLFECDVYDSRLRLTRVVQGIAGTGCEW